MYTHVFFFAQNPNILFQITVAFLFGIVRTLNFGKLFNSPNSGINVVIVLSIEQRHSSQVLHQQERHYLLVGINNLKYDLSSLLQSFNFLPQRYTYDVGIFILASSSLLI